MAPPHAEEDSSAGMKRVVSRNALLISDAYREATSGGLLLDPKEKKVVEVPFNITHVEAVDAASAEIKERILTKGSISSSRAREIIQAKMKILKILWEHFPGAMSSVEVLEGYKRVVEKRGYTPENTLFAQSVCPDEVNHEEGDITDLFTKYCGEVFHLGGLGGIPFTGKVGFGAFSHHVPENVGHCSVLLAPHIGMDSSGNFGVYDRDGQSHAGSCCGAAVGAYVHCRSGKPVPDLAVNPELYQFNYIVNQVHQRMHKIVGETESQMQASLAEHMHDIGSSMLQKCISLDFGGEGSTVVVLTGIQINMPRPFNDFFQPLEFFILRKDGSKEDVFEEAFHGTTPR